MFLRFSKVGIQKNQYKKGWDSLIRSVGTLSNNEVLLIVWYDIGKVQENMVLKGLFVHILIKKSLFWKANSDKHFIATSVFNFFLNF